MDEWYPYANNITLSKYAFELLELFSHEKVSSRFPGFAMGLFGHSPDTVGSLCIGCTVFDINRVTSGTSGPSHGTRRRGMPLCLASMGHVRYSSPCLACADVNSLPYKNNDYRCPSQWHLFDRATRTSRIRRLGA